MECYRNMMDSKSPRLKARYREQHGKAHWEVKRRVRPDKSQQPGSTKLKPQLFVMSKIQFTRSLNP